MDKEREYLVVFQSADGNNQLAVRVTDETWREMLYELSIWTDVEYDIKHRDHEMSRAVIRLEKKDEKD